MSIAFERLLGPGALYGLILVITQWICWLVMGLYLNIGGGYSSMGSCYSNTPCDRKNTLNSSELLCSLLMTHDVWLALDVVVRAGILMLLPSVEGHDMSQPADHIVDSSASSNHSIQCFFFVDQMRLV